MKKDINLAFQAYAKNPTEEEKNHLISACTPLVFSLAKKFTYQQDDSDDIRQIGMIGLVKAIKRFNITKQDNFLMFAVPTIIGEIKHYFRDTYPTLKIPRSLYAAHKQVKAYSQAFFQEKGVYPTVKDIHHETKLDETTIVEALNVGSMTQLDSLSTHDFEPSKAVDIEDKSSSPTQLTHQLLLKELMEKLSERERTIIQYRFFDDLTQSEISERLSLSQMHVSRLLQKILRKMKALSLDHT